MWVAAVDSDEVLRFDPATLKLVARIRVGAAPADLAAGDGAVWVANELAGTVSRIDVDENRVTKTIRVGDAPRFVAYGHGSLWVAGTLVDADAIESDC